MKELNLKPFRFWCHKIIPLIYDDSLSYYELLCKVVKYLNEVIENQNAANEAFDTIETNFKQLKYYVEHYFDDLDVTEEINNKLDQMAESGALADLIAAYLPTSNETLIYPEYLASAIYADGRYDQDNIRSLCSIIQSICVLDDTHAVGLVCRPLAAHPTNYANLIEFNPQTGIITNTHQDVLVGHGNDMCTDGTYLYVAWDYTFAEDYTYTPSNKISKISLADFSVVEVIDPEVRAISIGFDEVNKEFYIGSTGTQYFVFNNDFSVMVRSFELKSENFWTNYYTGGSVKNVFQSCNIVNGYLYQVYSYPNVMVRYDLNGNIMQIYNFPYQLGNGGSIGELESVCWDNYNKRWLGVAFGVMGLRDYDVNSFFIFNLKKGQVIHCVPDATTRYNYPAADIYVDHTVGTNNRMIGSAAYPFRFIQQAVDYARMEQRPMRIIVRYLDTAANHAYGCVNIGAVDNLQITSYTAYNNTEIKRYFIPVLHIEQASNILITLNNAESLIAKKVTGLQLGHCRIKTAELERVQCVRFGTDCLFDELIDYNLCLIDNYKDDQAPEIKIRNSTNTVALPNQGQ